MDKNKIEEILSKYEELRVQKFIDLTTDFGFKRIFSNKEFMIDFLNDLFKAYRKNIRVKSVKYLNTESNGEVAKDKHVVFDLKCESDSGDIFIVEMQKRDQEHFNDRVAYYMDRTVAEQGEIWRRLVEVWSQQGLWYILVGLQRQGQYKQISYTALRFVRLHQQAQIFRLAGFLDD